LSPAADLVRKLHVEAAHQHLHPVGEASRWWAEIFAHHHEGPRLEDAIHARAQGEELRIALLAGLPPLAGLAQRILQPLQAAVDLEHRLQPLLGFRRDEVAMHLLH